MSGAVLLAAQSAAAAPDSRCSTLFDIYYRYVSNHTHMMDGEWAQAHFAQYQCKSGHMADGVRSLEAILDRNLLPYPKE